MSRIDPSTPIGSLAKGKSKYLAKEDVGRAGMILTVDGFTTETIKGRDDQEDEEKTILHFREDVKPMVLNKTNAELLQLFTGATTAGEAKGKRIKVFDDPTIMYGGKRVGGVRIGDAQESAPARRKPVQRDEDPGMDPDDRAAQPDPGEDEIPF